MRLSSWTSPRRDDKEHEGSTSAAAIPQLLKEFFSATATPQFRNHNFFLSPQHHVRNLRALLLQFSADFWRGVA
jgi:hypothetical protein